MSLFGFVIRRKLDETPSKSHSLKIVGPLHYIIKFYTAVTLVAHYVYWKQIPSRSFL